MRSLLKDKRGDVTDGMVFLLTVFILAIGMFIFAFVIPEITDGLKEGGLNNSPEGIFAIDELESVGVELIQRGFVVLFAGLVIGVMISAFLTRTHPIFLFLYVFFLILTVFIGTYLGNAYEQLAETPIFAETLASQVMINAVMTNIINIVIGVSALSMIIVFAKFSTLKSSGAERP